jgi:hypothetical protein
MTLTSAAVDVAVTARTQRFFPVSTLKVPKIQATKDLLYSPDHGIKPGAVRFALIWNKGNLSSSPSISRLYTGKGFLGLANSSADTDRLYAVRAIDADHLKLYNSYQEAQANTGAFNLTGLTSGYTNVTDVGLATATSNWCWNACSQMLMHEDGKFFEQDDIADYAFLTEGVGRYLNWGNHLSSENVALAGFTIRRGVARIIKDLANIESQVHGPLDNNRITQELTASRPMIFQIGWYPDAKKPKERDGGHVFVSWGFDGTNLKIHDPWPTLGTQTLNMATLRVNGYQSTGRWEATLATGKSLDVVFLIDSTGSMGDDIANAKANATAIINNISTNFEDYRIAVVEYRDFPQSPWGNSGDFITKVRTTFTTSAATAISAINAMTTGGGNDWPEAVYSAAYATLEGDIIGGWRDNPTNRMIIMMGDAPGHEPEAWTGGKTMAQVMAKANNPAFPIRLSAVTIGSDTSARATFDAMTSLTGGANYSTATAAGVSTAITEAINDLAESTRFPRLEATVLKPKFTFPESISPASDDPPTSIVLQLQKMDLAKSIWKSYSTVTLPATATSWIPAKALPVGLYRWRLTYKFDAGTLRDPSGGVLEKVAAKVVTDNTWSGFQRLPALPEAVTKVTPATGFTATAKTVTYTFNTSIHSTSYVLEIYTGGKLWKKVTLAPSAKTPDAVTLTASIKDHSIGKYYTWRIQGLNIDRPKPDANAWK